MYTLITKTPLTRAIGFVDEISESSDGYQLFNNKIEIGVLSNSDSELIPGTNRAEKLKDVDILGKFFVIQQFVSKKNKYMVDLFPTIKKLKKNRTKKKGEEVVFCMRSKPLLCEKSTELKEALVSQTDVPVWIVFGESASTEESSRIIYCVEKRFHEGKPKPSDDLSKLSCGRFAITDEMPTIPVDLFMENGSVLEGAARIPKKSWHEKGQDLSGNFFEVVFDPNAKKSNKTRDFAEIILRLNDECIDHPDNLGEKIEFMRQADVSEDLIEAVLNSYICYHGMERLKIKHPIYPFQDSPDGYLSRALTYLLTGSNVRFVGDKGCGKNTLLDTLSWLLNQPLYKIGCSERTDEYTVFGSTQIKDGNTFHKLSPFASGLIKGGLCVLDEANAASPELLIVINQLADKTREVDINNYGLLRLHDRTRLCLTMNEAYQGVAMMNEATVDRFQGIFMESGMNITQLFKFLVKDADDQYIKIAAAVYKDIKGKVSSGILDPSCVTIRGYQDALIASKYLPIKTALLDSIAGRVQIEEDRQTITSIINGKAVAHK